MSNTVTARVIVIGRVQGVFYRQSTKEKAASLGLVGWVRNEDDGSVAFEATGPESSVHELIAWSRQGPPAARVEEVSVEWLQTPSSESVKFEIVR